MPQQQCTIPHRLLCLRGGAVLGPHILGSHHGGHTSAGTEQSAYHGDGRIGIEGEVHRRHIRHLAQPRLAQRRVLVRLFVLAVLPGVRAHQHRHRHPLHRAPRLQRVAGKDHFLTHGAQHLHCKGLVAHRQTQALLVGQRSADHGLFVERGDDGALQGFRHALLGRRDPVLQQVERLVHAIAAHLVGIAHPHALLRIGQRQRAHPLVDGGHRRRVGRQGNVLRLRQHGRAHLQLAQAVIALQHALLHGVGLQRGDGVLQLSGRHMQHRAALVEERACQLVGGAAARQWQVVRRVGAGTGEAVALDRLGDRVGQQYRVAGETILDGFVLLRQTLRHVHDRPGEGGRVAPVDVDGFETVELQMFAEPVHAARLGHGGALVDAAAIGDHDRHHQPGVLAPPPARRPVAAALLLEGAVTEKAHQLLARQRHVHILQAGEAQIAAFADAAGGMDIDMAAQRRGRTSVRPDLVTVEVLAQTAEPLVAQGIALVLFRLQIAGQHVHGIDRRHAVSLPHHPGPGLARQRIGKQVADIGRHDVQGTAGMPLGHRFEIGRRQGASVQRHLPRIGHVRRQPQAHAGQTIGRRKQPPRALRRALPGDVQILHQSGDALPGIGTVGDHPQSLAPLILPVIHVCSPEPVR